MDPYQEEDTDTIKNIIRCNTEFHGHSKRDWVVVWDSEKLQKEVYGINQYKVGQLQLLFSINQNEHRYNLAYIEWFNIADRADHETQLPIATRMKRFSVIEVSDIVRNIHLIPYFESQNSAITAKQICQDIYSFKKYLVNPYSDREAWELFYL